MTLGLTNTGSAPLVRATVNPFVRENLSVRGSMVRVNHTDNTRRILTNSRLRLNHLIALDVTSSNRKFIAATKDHNGLWTEWSDAQTLSFANFSSGSTQASIGSAATTDLLIEEPGVLFPSLEIGSARMHSFRTMVGSGFYDEERRQMAPDARAVFTVFLNQIEDESSQLLQRWFKSLNGAWRPFFFDFADPSYEDDVLRAEKRYVVRFRDPSIAESLFVVDRSSFRFTLVEVLDSHIGGNI